jgi:hypothetical protein
MIVEQLRCGKAIIFALFQHALEQYYAKDPRP